MMLAAPNTWPAFMALMHLKVSAAGEKWSQILRLALPWEVAAWPLGQPSNSKESRAKLLTEGL